MLQKIGKFLYFRGVNRKTTIKKQLISGCLLAVFLFISIVKISHTHETIDATNFPNTIEHVETSSSCSICDYHFTKDADFEVPIFILAKPQTFLVTYTSYQSRITSSIGLNYADRGPPALS
jgi:hypothetical protein